MEKRVLREMRVSRRKLKKAFGGRAIGRDEGLPLRTGAVQNRVEEKEFHLDCSHSP